MFPVVGSALSKTSRRLNRRRGGSPRARATRSHGSVESIVPGSGERTRCRGFGTLPSTRRTALCDRRVAITRDKGQRELDQNGMRTTIARISLVRRHRNFEQSRDCTKCVRRGFPRAFAREIIGRERERERERRRAPIRSKFGTRACRRAKIKGHKSCVRLASPMNINENHCAVYRPINPRVKIFRLWWCFIGRCCTAPLSRGRRGGRGNVIISPIDHPTRGPSTLFGPFVRRA